MRAILDDPSAVGNATSRAPAFRTREPAAYLYDGSLWKAGFIGGDYRWLIEDGVGGHGSNGPGSRATLNSRADHAPVGSGRGQWSEVRSGSATTGDRHAHIPQTRANVPCPGTAASAVHAGRPCSAGLHPRRCRPRLSRCTDRHRPHDAQRRGGVPAGGPVRGSAGPGRNCVRAAVPGGAVRRDVAVAAAAPVPRSTARLARPRTAGRDHRLCEHLHHRGFEQSDILCGGADLGDRAGAAGGGTDPETAVGGASAGAAVADPERGRHPYS